MRRSMGLDSFLKHSMRSSYLTSYALAWSRSCTRVAGHRTATPRQRSSLSIAQLIVVSYRAAILAIVSRLVIVPPYAVRPRGWCPTGASSHGAI